MCLFTSLAAIALITRILVLFNIESERLVEIWRERDAVAGLWACLGCLIVASFEVLLGVSSCSAGLRFDLSLNSSIFSEMQVFRLGG